jgi:hypothetical protein
MGNPLFWLGIGAAQKGARSKRVEPTDRGHRVIPIVVGILLALLIAAGSLSFVGQPIACEGETSHSVAPSTAGSLTSAAAAISGAPTREHADNRCICRVPPLVTRFEHRDDIAATSEPPTSTL